MKNEQVEAYDNTRLSAFKRCPRYYYFRHNRHLILGGDRKAALVFGSSWHAAMDKVWGIAQSSLVRKSDILDVAEAGLEAFLTKWQEEGFPADGYDFLNDKDLAARNPGVAHEMLINYVSQRQSFFAGEHGTFKILEIEKPFAILIRKADPEKNTNDVYYIGRMDKVVEWAGRIWVFEHKTTSMYAKAGGIRQQYLDGFSPNAQVDGYAFGAFAEYGKKFKGVMIDVALVHKTVNDKFTMHPVVQRKEQLDAWLFDAQHWVNSIQYEQQFLQQKHNTLKDYEYLPAFPKNTNSCVDFGSLCAYSDLCKMVPNPARIDDVPQGYETDVWEPIDFLEFGDFNFSKKAVQ